MKDKKFVFLITLFLTVLMIFGCSLFNDKPKSAFEEEEEEGATPIDYNAMVTVPAINSFTMGYAGVAEPPHTLTSPSISSFKMGKYEVTYERWYTVRQWAILPANGYTFANAGREGNNGTIGTAPTSAKNEPVTSINWRDCIVWCNAASQHEGLTPVYCTNAGFTTVLKVSTNTASINTTAGSEDNPYVNWSANGYRLPTEAEWEACARYINGTLWLSGTYASGATADYNNAAATGLVAWYSANSGNATHNAGAKNANNLSIYDMSGNVYEWCWDWSGVYTTSAPYTDSNSKGHAYDPANPYRLIRGGSWNYNAINLRSSYRGSDDPYAGYNNIGFRVCRTL